MLAQGSQQLISVGDRVSVSGNSGKVQFVGYLDEDVVAQELWVGIKLDEAVHLGHDGTYNGKYYFHCTPGHGIMVRFQDVTLLKPANKRPPVNGNPMFPSWPEICKRRKQRDQMLETMHRKNNKVSLSSAERAPTRPPAILPRENRTLQLRREGTIMPSQKGTYLIVSNDPYDINYKDNQRRQNKELLVATMKKPESTQVQWEYRQMQQWHQKYGDPEKVDRMSATLLKLRSAYKEGQNIRPVTADQ